MSVSSYDSPRNRRWWGGPCRTRSAASRRRSLRSSLSCPGMGRSRGRFDSLPRAAATVVCPAMFRVGLETFAAPIRKPPGIHVARGVAPGAIAIERADRDMIRRSRHDRDIGERARDCRRVAVQTGGDSLVRPGYGIQREVSRSRCDIGCTPRSWGCDWQVWRRSTGPCECRRLRVAVPAIAGSRVSRVQTLAWVASPPHVLAVLAIIPR